MSDMGRDFLAKPQSRKEKYPDISLLWEGQREQSQGGERIVLENEQQCVVYRPGGAAALKIPCIANFNTFLTLVI